MTLNKSSGDPIIIDPDALHPVVETGSFNFSYSAGHRNAEHALIVRDDRSLAEAYERYFKDAWLPPRHGDGAGRGYL
jgi:phosphatidylserine/phosphatidylglycerophosphate/cardiolipin synthase-like enzyme